jgi:hypothetical protein
MHLSNHSFPKLKRSIFKRVFRLIFQVSAMMNFLFNGNVVMAESTPDFAQDVLPILERSCLSCHGPEKQKSGYRLDVRDIAIKGGDSGFPAIVPHDAEKSVLIELVSGSDPEMIMPPEKSKSPPLTDEEVELLRDWIAAGPSWPDELAGELEEATPHWSLEPLKSPAVHGNEVNPIDSFIIKALEQNNLTPSPKAGKTTLIKRLYYDLVGLPPTPEEVQVFVADSNPKAYEKLVDQLLASPRYGERWARHWLDTIQFADTHGYEHDIAREHAWSYRDYVITSLNGDKSWRRFIREQLATDYFYPDEPQLTPALGYLGATPFDLSTYITSGVTFDYLDRDSMVTQTMAAFVSTTANCARCHDHKFDPIPQQDYYALQAVFSGVIKGDVAYDADPKTNSERKLWNRLLTEAQSKDTNILLRSDNVEHVKQWLSKRQSEEVWIPLNVDTFQSTDGVMLTRLPNGAIRSGGPRPDKATYTITGTTDLTTITALRLNVFTVDKLPKKGPGRHEGNFHLSEIAVRIFKQDELNPVEIKLSRATADFNQIDWSVETAIDKNTGTAWGIHPAVGLSHHAVFEFEEALAVKPGDRLSIVLDQLHGSGHIIGEFSLDVSGKDPESVVALPAAVSNKLSKPSSELTESEHLERVTSVMRFIAEDTLAEFPEYSLVYAAAPSVDMPDGTEGPKLVTIDTPKPVYRMVRGNFDDPAELVEPGALSALNALSPRFTLDTQEEEASRRAALADWIAHPDNVLTWRSIVNRVWHYHFGRGLCDTPSDIGRMGGRPSHPELIDWLAVWFRDDAQGSLKALHKLIATSETYQQSSAIRAEALEIDEGNRLLWRQYRHRLDADAYRDYTRSMAGTLDLRMGGPGIQEFTQGPGPQLTPALDYGGFDWDAEGANRRSIYRFVWRGIADPFMESLDFPDLGLLAPKREFSVSSLQALTLYNNEFVLHHAQAIANRLAEESPDLNTQIARATQLAWHRNPTGEELREFQDFVQKHGLAAICRVILNSNEYLFVD